MGKTIVPCVSLFHLSSSGTSSRVGDFPVTLYHCWEDVLDPSRYLRPLGSDSPRMSWGGAEKIGAALALREGLLLRVGRERTGEQQVGVGLTDTMGRGEHPS